METRQIESKEPDQPIPSTPPRRSGPNASTPGNTFLRALPPDSPFRRLERYIESDQEDSIPVNCLDVLTRALDEAESDFALEMETFLNILKANDRNLFYFLRYVWNLRIENQPQYDQGEPETRLFQYIIDNLTKGYDMAPLYDFLKGGRSQEFQVVFNRFVISLGRYPEEIIQSITGLDRDFQSVNDESYDQASETEDDSEGDMQFFGTPVGTPRPDQSDVGNLSVEGEEGGSERLSHMDDSGFDLDLSGISNVSEDNSQDNPLMLENLDISRISVDQGSMDSSMDSIGVQSEDGSLSELSESFDEVVVANDPDNTSLHKIRLRF